MTEQLAAEGAEYQDDTIFLDRVEFPIDGPIRGTAISEFSTGLKVGKATYDEREHAFWAVFDDFSGGFARKILDTREAGGTHWDNDGGVDLRRPRHITLPPKRVTLDPDDDPDNMAYPREGQVGVVSNVHNTVGQVYLPGGSAIYRLLFSSTNGMREFLVKVFEMPNTSRVQRIVEFIGSDGVKGLYACGPSTGAQNNEYHRSITTDTDLVWTTGASIPNNSGTVFFTDFIVWNRQLLGQTTDRRIISSADGANWSIDASTPEDEIYRASSTIQFIGVAMAPWGEPAVYFLDSGRLYVLDFQVRTAYEIEDVGRGQYLTTGVVWGGSLYLTNSTGVFEYSPGSRETVRWLGPFGKEGTPPTYNDKSGYHIAQFLPGDESLYTIFRSASTTSYRLGVYNGAGWSWLSSDIPSAFPVSAIIDRLPIDRIGGAATRYLDIITTGPNTTSTDVTLNSYKLPRTDVPGTRTPTSSFQWRSMFEDGPASWEWGWYDGGFSELEGVLFRMELDGFGITETETVQVEYRLNNNEDAAFTNLGTFTRNKGQIWFDLEHKGVPFKTVQFRVTLNRRTASNENPTPSQMTDAISRDYTYSPELKSLILLFDKKPLLRTAWTARIDINRMKERTDLRLNGDPVTSTEQVWQYIKALRDQPKLIKLQIPSVETGGINVRIADMPATFDDFRKSVKGKGFIDLQMLEPVGRG